MSSITGTSFMPCGANPWRCATCSTATSCSLAMHTGAPSRRCSTPRANALLALAHERGCEAALANELDACLDAGALPDPEALAALFVPTATALPTVNVELGSLTDYDVLLSGDPVTRAPVTAGGAS